MKVTRTQLENSYRIDPQLYFEDRTKRNQFFIDNPYLLTTYTYCAIGDDTSGWELEQYNGINWMLVIPDTTYNLTITSKGLAALTNVYRGGFKLNISGVKIIDGVVKNPAISMKEWTESNLLRYGNIKYAIGTNDAKEKYDDNGNSKVREVLSWRYNSATGGMQYILTLGPRTQSIDGEDDWDVGTIGLYVKDPTNSYTDILFAIATLPSVVKKYGDTTTRVGNKLKFYFNAMLTNLGFVSNLDVLEDGEQSLPEVPNESVLDYPSDATLKPYNCYIVDDCYGTGIPALAVPKRPNYAVDPINTEWTYFFPSDNTVKIPPEKFANDVKNYMAVYWDAASGLYKRAEGRIPEQSAGINEKMPIGIRVNDNIVYSGEIVNLTTQQDDQLGTSYTAYNYSIQVQAGGTGYAENDELLLVINEEALVLKLKVMTIGNDGAITSVKLIGPRSSSIKPLNNPDYIEAVYDPRSTLPRNGTGARMRVTYTGVDGYAWNFSESDLNKPVYCDLNRDSDNNNAGKPTTMVTDCMLGWCTGRNSIRLNLDLRNEATETRYGTTRYATDTEVKDSIAQVNAANQTAITPKTLKNNYLQITKTNNIAQAGNTLANPIEVDTYVHFNEVVLGRGVPRRSSYDSLENIHDNAISFYGLSYRSFYGDLAEFYEADEKYEAGTLITMGKGIKEISQAVTECNGVISTNPGYQLGEKKSELYLPVALVGRVPVMFDGNCMPKFGDRIYLSKVKPGCASTIENGKCLGKVIQKDIKASRLIECSIRIDF